jgi:hypothetical protein
MRHIVIGLFRPALLYIEKQQIKKLQIMNKVDFKITYTPECTIVIGIRRRRALKVLSNGKEGHE